MNVRLMISQIEEYDLKKNVLLDELALIIFIIFRRLTKNWNELSLLINILIETTFKFDR